MKNLRLYGWFSVASSHGHIELNCTDCFLNQDINLTHHFLRFSPTASRGRWRYDDRPAGRLSASHLRLLGRPPGSAQHQ